MLWGSHFGDDTAAGRGPMIGVFANFAQFIYDDINPQNPIGPFPGGLPTTDAYRSYAIRESLMSLGAA